MMGKSLSLFGAALTLALSTNVAVAQSSQSPVNESSNSSADSATEIKLSPEGFKILCERSPLNSRCPGGTPLTPAASGSTTIPEDKSFEGGTTPGNLAPVPGTATPDSTAPGNLAPVPGTATPDSTAPGNLAPVPGTATPDSSAPGNLAPVPGTATPDSSAPGNLAPVPGTATPDSSAPGNLAPVPGTSTGK
ncbi:hypothetical protein [Fortiea contorta]|uniref:hypothetical protein n=1 Tax=Fortiea contorta TaxID=1892405 RepID=UPI00058E829F|nr:hypothetical protein [Fortiea contorta]